MSIDAIFFDLDETLMIEDTSVEETFDATCRAAEEACGLDRLALAASVRRLARKHYREMPVHPWCMALGISSWECLGGPITGDHPNLEWLGRAQPDFRLKVWREALTEHGVGDAGLAPVLAETFCRERRARHVLYDDAVPALSALERRYGLVLVTNGPPQLQREKLAATGIERFFDGVIISGEVGIGKPDEGIFEKALSSVGVAPGRSVMVGDSLARDMAGAKRAGLFSIWINRKGRRRAQDDIEPDAEVTGLGELEGAISRLPAP